MARNSKSFQPTVDIWSPYRDLVLPRLQRGQWVRAGSKGDLGRFYGVKPSGTIVVAWQGNAQRHRGKGAYRAYQQALLNYAKG